MQVKAMIICIHNHFNVELMRCLSF